MRTIAAVIVSLALAVPAFAETTPAPPVNQGLEAGNAISSSYINLVYTPVKVVVAVRAALVAVPLVPTLPDHAPAGELEAVHEVVLLLDHLRLAVPPEEMLVAVAWSVAVAAGGACCTSIEYVAAASVPPGCATMLRK